MAPITYYLNGVAVTTVDAAEYYFKRCADDPFAGNVWANINTSQNCCDEVARATDGKLVIESKMAAFHVYVDKTFTTSQSVSYDETTDLFYAKSNVTNLTRVYKYIGAHLFVQVE